MNNSKSRYISLSLVPSLCETKLPQESLLLFFFYSRSNGLRFLFENYLSHRISYPVNRALGPPGLSIALLVFPVFLQKMVCFQMFRRDDSMHARTYKREGAFVPSRQFHAILVIFRSARTWHRKSSTSPLTKNHRKARRRPLRKNCLRPSTPIAQPSYHYSWPLPLSAKLRAHSTDVTGTCTLKPKSCRGVDPSTAQFVYQVQDPPSTRCP